MDSNHIMVSTDSFVIKPEFFNGGDIGRLAICGTVNDVATSGAIPLYLTAAFVLEEGYPLAQLAKIVDSMAKTAEEAGVRIVTGDTKVVGRGELDGIMINTTGIGIPRKPYRIGGDQLQAGDKIILSGSLGDHGIAVMAERLHLDMATQIASDVAPLNRMLFDLVWKLGATGAVKTGQAIHAFRDPTRGGLAATLNEFCKQSQMDILIEEAAIPQKDAVRAVCGILGFDVLQVANEGKIVCACAGEAAPQVLEIMQDSPYGKEAAVIGEVLAAGAIADGTARPYLQTEYGSRRIIDNLAGEQLPRIC
jgi:hydrogenase expression/formation protein HypE